jgi:hypothetical protein
MKRYPNYFLFLAISILSLMVLASCPAPTSGIGTPTASPSPDSGGEIPSGGSGYTITYDGNGGNGNAPVDGKAYQPGDTVTVMSTYGSGLELSGYALAGWTTKIDGPGTSYAFGATFAMGRSDLTLYAVWIPRNLLFNSGKTEIQLTGHCMPYPSGSLIIPAGVTRIAAGALYGCTGLTDISIPASVTSLGAGAFYGCSSLTAISVAANNPNYQSISGTVFDKTGATLVAVPPGSLAGSYAIPSGVANIGPRAFNGSTSLSDLSIPASVTGIGELAFLGCSNLTSFSVDADNPDYKSISGVLYDKIGTTILLVPEGLSGNYVIPAGVTSIAANTFYSCQKLTSVDIPSSVAEIGDHAFEFCIGLTNITIPGSVPTIGDYAFNDCYALNKVIIEPGVISIGADAFCDCPMSEGVIFPDGVVSIAENAFLNCSGLTRVTIPSSVARIDSGNFSVCPELTEILVDPANPNYESISGVLFDTSGTSLTLMRVPEGMSGRYDIPAGVAAIGVDAIGGCSALTEITIPDSVVSIGAEAFRYCSALTSVTLAADTPPDLPYGSQAFFGCPSALKIHVPDAAAYANATGSAIGWRDYASKIVSP